MASQMLRISTILLLLIVVSTSLLLSAKASGSPQHAHLLVERAFGNEEQLNSNNNSPMNGGGAVEGDVMDKVESRLLGALELLRTYKDVPIVLPKFTEKRKNKFEFIRFGKRRR